MNRVPWGGRCHPRSVRADSPVISKTMERSLIPAMLPRGPTIRQRMTLAVLLLTVAWPVMAQVFDLDKDRQPVVVLDGCRDYLNRGTPRASSSHRSILGVGV